MFFILLILFVPLTSILLCMKKKPAPSTTSNKPSLSSSIKKEVAPIVVPSSAKEEKKSKKEPMKVEMKKEEKKASKEAIDKGKKKDDALMEDRTMDLSLPKKSLASNHLKSKIVAPMVIQCDNNKGKTEGAQWKKECDFIPKAEMEDKTPDDDGNESSIVSQRSNITGENEKKPVWRLCPPKKLANGRVQYVSMFNENSMYSDDSDNDFVMAGDPKETKTEDKMDPKKQ